ncbi:MAG: AMP-dependent synthetase/ligase [Kiritimatiellia bacterium]|jgi:long-chain acyl-CoA synthetase
MTIRTLLDQAVAHHGDLPALEWRTKTGKKFVSYREMYAGILRISTFAGGELGLEPQRDMVGLMLDNSPEWVKCYLALSCCGITVIPLDPKLKPEETAYILRDARAAGIIVSARHPPRLDEILPGLDDLRFVVKTDFGEEPLDSPGSGETILDRPVFHLPTALAHLGDDHTIGDFFRAHVPGDDDIASLLYTSGTTGKPKGAMITHANFCSDVAAALEAIPGLTPSARFLVVIPLFHSFSFTANLLGSLSLSSRMQFPESLRTLGEDLRVLAPSLVMGVPLLFEKLLARIKDNIRKSPAARLLKSCGLGFLVRRKVRASLGGNLKMLVTGGAPCSVAMLRGYKRLGIDVVEGYGLTECSPIVSVTDVESSRHGTIGLPLPGIEVRVADPNEQGVGELQVRGPIVMKGYFGKPEATAEVFTEDGFLRTGDLVSQDADGYLTIRGRVKALIVNREGKNIYPEEVEQCLANDPFVRDFLVLGVNEEGVTGEKVGAILVPDMDAVTAANKGVEPPWEQVEAMMRKRLRKACSRLADYKHPRVVEVRRESLERTAAMKIRRHVYNGALDIKSPAAPATEDD